MRWHFSRAPDKETSRYLAKSVLDGENRKHKGPGAIPIGLKTTCKESEGTRELWSTASNKTQRMRATVKIQAKGTAESGLLNVMLRCQQQGLTEQLQTGQ